MRIEIEIEIGPALKVKMKMKTSSLAGLKITPAKYYLTALASSAWMFGCLDALTPCSFFGKWFRQRQSESETTADTALGCLKLALLVACCTWTLQLPEHQLHINIYVYRYIYINFFFFAFQRSSVNFKLQLECRFNELLSEQGTRNPRLADFRASGG